MRSMRSEAAPYARLIRAIQRRKLAQAEAAARELPRIDPEHALALVMLMGAERDVRYEPAMVRWLGQWLAAHPQIGLELGIELAGALADLTGAAPDVARARAALLIRSSGDKGSAGVLERW